jgi:hypothetical protein
LADSAFVGFKDCAGSWAIATNPYETDNVPIHTITNTPLEATPGVFIHPPATDNATCGTNPCSALSNVIIHHDGSLGGTVHTTAATESIVSANSGILASGCVTSAEGNYANCAVPYEKLVFAPKPEYPVSTRYDPVTVTGTDSYTNVLNSFAGHAEPNQRLNQFMPALPVNNTISIDFSNEDLPQTTNWNLTTTVDPYASVLVSLNYNGDVATDVFYNEVEVSGLALTPEISGVTHSMPGGSNFWYHAEKRLQFLAKGEGTTRVVIVEAMELQFELDCTIEEFYAENGFLTFIERLAKALNINIH